MRCSSTVACRWDFSGALSVSESSRNVLDDVRRSLGRTRTSLVPPTPPPIPDLVARLVHSPIGLPELFAKRASDLKMLVEPVRVDELTGKMADFLRGRKCRSVMLS